VETLIKTIGAQGDQRSPPQPLPLGRGRNLEGPTDGRSLRSLEEKPFLYALFSCELKGVKYFFQLKKYLLAFPP